MKVHTTKHFKERVVERFKSNITEKEDFLISIFKDWIKQKIKREKRDNWTLVIRIKEFKFIFSEPVGGECTLITFWVRDDTSKYDKAKKFFSR